MKLNMKIIVFDFITGPGPQWATVTGIINSKYSKDNIYISVFVLTRWSLLPNALQPFKIYCALTNLGIRT